MTTLGSNSRRLLAAGDRFDPPPEARARVRNALARRLGAAGAVGTVTAGTTAAARAAGLGAAASHGAGIAAAPSWLALPLTVPVVKWLSVIAIAGAVGGGVVASTNRASAPVTDAPRAGHAPSARARDLPNEIPPPPPPPHVETHAVPASSPTLARSSAPAAPHVEAPLARKAAVSSLGAEAALLRDAQLARASGDNARALEILARHDDACPNGSLRDIATTERVLALCALGRDSEARELARPLLESPSVSPLAARLRESCAREKP